MENDDWTIEGLKYAERMGADIINCSWGNDKSHDAKLTTQINKMATQGRDGRGCIIVASSGNSNSTTLNYPASLPNVISVGASWQNGARWEDSNYGSDLDLVAPGVQIYTTTQNNDYENFTGTSASTPHVSGVAALMLSVNPNLTRTQLKKILCQTCQKPSRHTFSTNGTYGKWNDQVGYGIVDAYDALRMIQFQKSTLVENDPYTYMINNLPRKARVVWSSSSSDFTLTNPADSVARILTRDCGKSTTLTAKVCYDDVLIKQFTKNISSVLDVEGSGHISCCGLKAHRIGYLPYGATFSWNVSDNVDIDSQKGDSIRVSTVKGTSFGYWIEAVVHANGKTYAKRKTLLLREKEKVDMEFLSDSRGPNGSKRFAIYADPIDNNGRSMRDIPEETIVYWRCRRSPDSKTETDAILESEDLITNSSLIKVPSCMKSSTIRDSISIQPSTFSVYPVDPPVDPFPPVKPWDTDDIDVTKIDSPHRLKVTLPNDNYIGIVTCSVFSQCTKTTSLNYMVDKNGISAYKDEGMSPFLYSTPPYRVTSSNPTSDFVSIRKVDMEENSSSLHEVKLMLYNDYGLVRTVNGTSEEEILQMNISDLPKGTYYLNVVTGNDIIKQVVRIEH
ncbi:S8 family peptidase [Oscillospiraceae bacterium N12]|uniref:S8 family peptidase n=1 Tax=Jilunia laotingensis TaxID=2763675 RepID=A0A926IQ44_9BACT|nr:S8 family peptidase [Jilunia laotingensis]